MTIWLQSTNAFASNAGSWLAISASKRISTVGYHDSTGGIYGTFSKQQLGDVRLFQIENRHFLVRSEVKSFNHLSRIIVTDRRSTFVRQFTFEFNNTAKSYELVLFSKRRPRWYFADIENMSFTFDAASETESVQKCSSKVNILNGAQQFADNILARLASTALSLRLEKSCEADPEKLSNIQNGLKNIFIPEDKGIPFFSCQLISEKYPAIFNSYAALFSNQASEGIVTCEPDNTDTEYLAKSSELNKVVLTNKILRSSSCELKNVLFHEFLHVGGLESHDDIDRIVEVCGSRCASSLIKNGHYEPSSKNQVREDMATEIIKTAPADEGPKLVQSMPGDVSDPRSAHYFAANAPSMMGHVLNQVSHYTQIIDKAAAADETPGEISTRRVERLADGSTQLTLSNGKVVRSMKAFSDIKMLVPYGEGEQRVAQQSKNQNLHKAIDSSADTGAVFQKNIGLVSGAGKENQKNSTDTETITSSTGGRGGSDSSSMGNFSGSGDSFSVGDRKPAQAVAKSKTSVTSRNINSRSSAPVKFLSDTELFRYLKKSGNPATAVYEPQVLAYLNEKKIRLIIDGVPVGAVDPKHIIDLAAYLKAMDGGRE